MKAPVGDCMNKAVPLQAAMPVSAQHGEEERRFSCSLFPKLNQTPDQVLQTFVAHQMHCIRDLITSLDHDMDLPYGDPNTANDRQQYDVWFPAEGAEKYRRIHIFVHGGYWQEGSRKCAGSVVPTLIRLGFTVITLGYTLATDIPLDEVVDLVRRGIKDIINKHPTAEFSISGHSAGGHLVAKVLEVEELGQNIDAAVLLAPVFNLRPLVDTYIGRNIRLSEDLAETCSVKLKELAKFEGKLAILTARHDAPGLLEQGQEVFQELAKLGKANALKEEFDEDHFGLLNVLSNLNSSVSEWMRVYLSPTARNSTPTASSA